MRKVMLLLIMCCVAGWTQAGSNLLDNAGFEQPGVVFKGGFDDATTDIPAWNSGPMTDQGVTTGEGPGAYEGTYNAILKGTTSWIPTSDGPAWQTTSHIIAASEVFTLTFQASASWMETATGEVTVTIYYTADGGTTRVAMDSVTVTDLTTSAWTAGTLTVTADVYPASVGNAVGVEIENLGNGWMQLDAMFLGIPDYALLPDPANGETGVAIDLSDRIIPNNLSWLAPSDPNIVEIKGYDLYLDPNDVKVSNRDSSCAIFQSTAADVTQYDPGIFGFLETYYWAVDTRYTRDTDPNVGTANEEIFVGSPPILWSFETVSAAPIIGTYNSVVVTESMLPASLTALVSDADNNLSSAGFTLLTNDVDFPNPGNYTLTDTTNPSNKYAPSCTFTADTPGYYKIKLTVSDGTNTTEDIAEVALYDDPNACAAAQFNWQTWGGFNSMDFDQDCHVDLADFAAFALQWLDNQSLKVPENYNWDIPYTPLVNGMLNGDFETGDFTGGYYQENAVVTDVNPIEGTYSAEWTTDATTGRGGIVAYQTVKASTNYEFSFKMSGGPTTAELGVGAYEILVRYNDTLATVAMLESITPTTPPAAQTLTIPFSTTAADEGKTLEFVIFSNLPASAGQYAMVDDLRLVELP